MKSRIFALAPVFFLAAACTAEAVDVDDPSLDPDAVGETQAALKKEGEGLDDEPSTGTGTSVGGVGGIDFSGLVPRKTPRVMARNASGNTITLKLDRALAADEIPLSQMKVTVVRKENGALVRRNLASSTTLSADKTTLSVALTEQVKAGEIYHPRGFWKPCSGSILGARCRVRPARFGQVLVRSNRSSALDLAQAPVGGFQLLALPSGLGAAPSVGTLGLSTSPSSPLFAAPTAATATALAAPPTTEVRLDEAPLPAQGTFRVKTVTPNDTQRAVRRDVDRIVVTFDGGTIDCARTGKGKEAFHVYTSTDGRMEQSMYDAPASEGLFRGSLRCEEDTNRIVFETPGMLLGDAWFKIELNAWSKEGNFMGNKVLEFETQRPGIQVFATRLENHYGGDNTCDDDIFGTNYCDIYVTTAVATASQNETKRIPETGDYEGMKDFRVDPSSGSRVLGNGVPIFARAEPIDELLQVNVWAHDADSDSAWKGIFSAAGKIAAAAGAALLPIKPEAGAIAEGVAAGLNGIAEAIPSNEDDTLGSAQLNLTHSDNRWGTQSSYPVVVEATKNHPNRGPVKLFLRTEELPRSWRPIIIE